LGNPGIVSIERAKNMKVCMVGYGMMGTWHSEALNDTHHELHVAVGRREEPLAAFAQKFGYRHWTTNLAAALADDEVDAVVIANPSEIHASTALASIAAGKATLVEIPIAMSLADAEQVVVAADAAGVTLAVVHPMRLRPEMVALRARIAARAETAHHVSARFFIRRLQNVGATGYRRSWTDNLLWHHMAHLVDFGCWMVGTEPSRIQSYMPEPDPRTGTPMDCSIVAEMQGGSSFAATGSYLGHERLYETLVVTDRDSYRIDTLGDTLFTGAGTTRIAGEQENCALVIKDFLAAVEVTRAPAVTGASVLPAMRMLQVVQDAWDARFGTHSLPGRL
jgi:2-hydroxy-4-carboxymuconate semialdehyde hemiacetal dehydrogenase